MKNSHLKYYSLLSLCPLFGALSTSVHTTEISNVPAFALGGVDPNVLLVLDNSSSMDDELLAVNFNKSQAEKAFERNNKKLSFSSRIFLGTPPIDAAAPNRSVAYNATYYDPETTYSPWVTFGNYAKNFTNANPKYAKWYPIDNIYPWREEPLDLTANAFFDFDIDDHADGFVCDNEGNETSVRTLKVRIGNGVRTADRDWLFCGNRQLDGIGEGEASRDKNFKTFRMTYDYNWAFYYRKDGNCGDESTWYPKAPCLKREQITDPGELQNFANWFTYYRNRLQILKGSQGEVLAENQYQTFSSAMFPINLRDEGEIQSFEKKHLKTDKTALNFANFQTAQGDFLKRIYEVPLLSSTPLRDALFTAGEIYAQTGAEKVVQYSCQANYTILFTDGFDTAQRLENIPLEIKNSDNKAEKPYQGLSGFTLADFSHYYYNNLSQRLSSDYPIDEQNVPMQKGCEQEKPSPWLDCNDKLHMTTFTIGMGARGNYYDPNNSGANSVVDVHQRNANRIASDDIPWTDDDYDDFSAFDKIDDLLHTAVNGKGEIESASNSQELKVAFSEILEQVFSDGLTNSGLDAGDSGVDEYFPDGRFLFRAKMNLASNTGDLTASLLKRNGSEESEIRWSAAKQLDDRNLSRHPRKIITFGENQGVHFIWKNLSLQQQKDLRTPPPGELTNRIQDGKERLAYLSGDRTYDGIKYRRRSSLLGAIASSTPIYNGKPSLAMPYRAPFGKPGNRYLNFKKTHENRQGVVFAGANDGMLHAFDAKTGEELFAYLPGLLFSSRSSQGLHRLTQKYSELRSYVDLPATVHDVFINNAWRSILVGGLRTGGPGIFVLDVTDPVADTENLNTPASIDRFAKQVVIGEYLDSGMGIMIQKPFVAMLNNGRWAAIFSSGYATPGGEEIQGQLYIVYLENAQRSDFVVKKIPTGAFNGLSPATLADVDGNATVDKVFAGDLAGNLWAFDLSSVKESDWEVKQIFAPSALQPITSSPAVAANPYLDRNIDGTYPLLVAFGTGKYLAESDVNTKGTQSFYVISDTDSSKVTTRSSLMPHRFAETDSDFRAISGTAPDWKNQFGWYIDLPAQEKIFIQPDIYGDNIAFFSSTPSQDDCRAGGKSWFNTMQLNGQKLSPNPYLNLPELDNSAGSVLVGENIIVGSQPIIIGDKRLTIGRGNNLEDFAAVQAINAKIQAKRTAWEELSKH